MAVNYYDSYIWDYNDSYPFNSDLTENSENVYGKLTSQKNRILNLDNPPDWLFTVYYYDQKGRLIETLKDNHLGGREIRLTEPDFDGKPTRSWIYHSLGQNTIREYYTPDYDHSDRLKKLWYSIDNESNSFTLYKNKYNSLGMLIERNYHSFDDLVYLQSVDFAYNSRGWLNRINNSNLNNNHHYIDIDQYLGANEAVDGVRLDSLIITLKEIDNELLELDYYDIKEMKIISLDSSSLDRYQSVNEHSLWQIKKGTIDEADFESLRNITDRTFTFLFNNVYFNSSDENQIIIDSLNNILTQQLVNAGINDQAVIEAFNRQIVSYILGSISFIYFNEDNDDLFGESIYYDATSQATQLPVIPQYDGNISAIKWQTTQNSGERSYCYTYDELNQLQQATYREKENGVWTRNVGRYDVSGITFDKNGNILSLERNGYIGIQGGNPAFGMMDDLSYTYSGNKLKAVEDAISNSGNDNNDFKDNGIHTTVEYEYDNNGNLISDDNKGIVSISYNYLNLPEEIIFSQTRKIAYLYASDGTKLRETITDGQLTHTFDYCGNMVYEDSELSYILNPAGRALPAVQEHEYIYEYFLTDHLGNVRVVYGDPDRDHVAEVIQENSFYPFGMTMGGLNYIAGLENRYLYQGKEATGDFGLWWSDFHARRFDSQLGRWHVPDPAVQFASPYVGMANNPVIAVDPDGRWAVGGHRWMGGITWNSSAIFQRQLDIMYGRTGAALDDFDINFIYGSSGYRGNETRCGGGGNPDNPDNPYEKTRTVVAGVSSSTGEVFPAAMDPVTGRWGFQYTRINPITPFIQIDNEIYKTNLNYELEVIWVNLGGDAAGQECYSGDGPLFTVADWTNNGIGGIAIGMGRSGGTFRLSNSRGLSPKHYASGWRGNGSVTTYNMATWGSRIAKGSLLINLGLGAFSINNAYIADGRTFGYNTQVATGQFIGGMAGSMAGAEIGAAIGVWFGGFGAIPGAVIGGVIGGVLCGWGGSELGGAVIEWNY